LQQSFICLDPHIDALRGHNFSNDHELKESVETSLAHRSENSFLMAYMSLWNAGPRMLKSKGTVSRYAGLNELYIVVVLILINILQIFSDSLS
jgi:hypothetical protein